MNVRKINFKAITFVAATSFCSFGTPVQQAVALMVVLVPLLLAGMRKFNSSVLFGIIMIFYIGVQTLLLSIFSPYKANIYHVFGELKVLFIFFAPYAFRALFSFAKQKNSAIEKRDDSSVKPIVEITQIYIAALAVVTVLGIAQGETRNTYIFGFSINAAYSLAYLVAVVGNYIPRHWKIMGAVVMAYLGSITGIAIYALSIARISRMNVLWKVAIVITFIPIIIIYSEFVRGRNFFETNLDDIDRIQLLQYYFNLVWSNFTPVNYLLGWGVGHEFTSGTYSSLSVIEGWFLNEFAVDGVFAFACHNEFIRLFVDFGPIGVVLVILYLYWHLPKWLFLMVTLGGMTATTIWSSHNMLVLSLLIAYQMSRHDKLAEVFIYRRLVGRPEAGSV